MRRRHLLQGAAAGAAVLFRPALAQSGWPARAIRMVVPFPPGSSPDLMARLLGEPLAKALGQPVLIENRPGAGGNVGTGAVAHARPDDHTFLFTIQGPLVTAPLLARRLPYDPEQQLAPVTLVATSPNVLVVDARLGVSTLAEFVRLARASRGELNYGSIGTGSASHLAMELFKNRAQVELVHIPYAGFPQVVNAMLAGEVQAGCMVPAIAMAQVRAGRLRALGVTALGRVASLAALPTLAEQGLPGFEAISWQAVLAPAGTSPEAIERMSGELVRIIKSDAMRQRMLAQYFSAAGTAPEALALQMRTEREAWARVIRAAGVQPE